ncbi:hypothetical protein E2C01_030482 [Portunus trituberculatus]|uniref:Uncharacterized protein n=1 Tax=Portunus trituberculatus TaxID=210409 RepID=A0A5B7EQJ8_PORTR|nr:hypothetical protein [Portunus trituberculatus]
MLTIKVLRNDAFHAFAGLNSWKAYGPDGVPPIVLKNCASVVAPCLAKLFQKGQLAKGNKNGKKRLTVLPFPLKVK